MIRAKGTIYEVVSLCQTNCRLKPFSAKINISSNERMHPLEVNSVLHDKSMYIGVVDGAR